MMRKLSIVFSFSILFSLPACVTKNTQQHTELALMLDSTLIVNCQLPARIKRLGPSSTYLSSRRPIKITSQECEIRGGEYIAYDRANYQNSIATWLPSANAGDALSQYYLAMVYSQGSGKFQDYAKAVYWLQQAANQNNSSAQFSLAYLIENGLGIEKNPNLASYWYQRAGGLDADKPANTSISNALFKSDIDIVITEPATNRTRSREPVVVAAAALKTGETKIRGKITSARQILYAKLNDIPIELDAMGNFSVTLNEQNTTLVEIIAVDDSGETAQKNIIIQQKKNNKENLLAGSKDLATREKGEYFALIIGNSRYQHLPNLLTPKNDAQVITRLLRNKYHFSEVRTLYNANRYQIITAINALRHELTEFDSLLVYYAGHGELDTINKTSQWLPVDAEPLNTANWISDTALSELINTMDAQHIMVIADSCYAGMMTRGVSARLLMDPSNVEVAHLARKKSRTVLTSGGVAPVLDQGAGRHSLFANAFISVLNNNIGPISGSQIYRQVSAAVAIASKNIAAEQVPEYAPIEYAGHDAGDFVLAVSQ